jgi:uncharacterized protein DUF5996
MASERTACTHIAAIHRPTVTPANTPAAAAILSSRPLNNANAGSIAIPTMRSPNTDPIRDARPALPYEAWKDTYATLHMWTQIVGKIALAHAAPLNHCWAVALLVNSRGLRTRVLSHERRSFTIAFDFLDHQLVIETLANARRALPLAPRSVADFYQELMTKFAISFTRAHDSGAPM